MTVFLSGPMSGQPFHGYPAFDFTAAKLRERGFTVVSPAELSREAGYTNCDENTTFSRSELSSLYQMDLEAMVDCDAVLLLDGWQHSKGCAVERAAATAFGIPVFETLSELLAARRAAA